MKTIVGLAVASFVVVPLVGCYSQTTSQAPQTAAQAQGVQSFTGEVWTWDTRENTVTLRQGAQEIRIKTTPDQLKGLQHHQITTIRGQLAPPADIVTTITPAAPMTAVPRGSAT